MIDPSKIANVTDSAPAVSPNGSARLTRDDLVGNVIAYSVNRYDPEAESKYGGTVAEVDVDVVVVTGPRAGTRDPDCRLRATLARQLVDRCPDEGATAVARVVTGTTDKGTWFGIEPATSGEVEAARLAVAEHVAGATRATTPPAPSTPSTSGSADVPPF